jgi:ATP-dependent Clp protease ATP-binding subunit ClpA
MLAGILDVPGSEAYALLRRAGVAVDGLREDIVGSLAGGSTGDIDAPLGPQAIAVLEQAARAAAGPIKSIHVLAGILHEGTSAAARLLQALGVTEKAVQAD